MSRRLCAVLQKAKSTKLTTNFICNANLIRFGNVLWGRESDSPTPTRVLILTQTKSKALNLWKFLASYGYVWQIDGTRVKSGGRNIGLVGAGAAAVELLSLFFFRECKGEPRQRKSFWTWGVRCPLTEKQLQSIMQLCMSANWWTPRLGAPAVPILDWLGKECHPLTHEDQFSLTILRPPFQATLFGPSKADFILTIPIYCAHKKTFSSTEEISTLFCVSIQNGKYFFMFLYLWKFK